MRRAESAEAEVATLKRRITELEKKVPKVEPLEEPKMPQKPDLPDDYNLYTTEHVAAQNRYNTELHEYNVKREEYQRQQAELTKQQKTEPEQDQWAMVNEIASSVDDLKTEKPYEKISEEIWTFGDHLAGLMNVDK